MGLVINFSYGSNMLSRRIAQRVPSARPAGHALLRGHELKWHKQGADGSGKCDIVASPRAGAVVHGVVYTFDALHKPLLDAVEGLGRGYDEMQLEVELQADGRALRAWAYVATATDPACLPYTWYRALVVAGAREHRLPAGYVSVLAAAPAVADADRQRACMNFALAGPDSGPPR